MTNSIAKVIALTAALAACCQVPLGAAAQAPDMELIQQALQSPGIRVRAQKDHRLMIYPEEFALNKSCHVVLTLWDRPDCYSFTLGWFEPASGRDATVWVDEFGESIPSPGAKPESPDFSKADLDSIRAFDLISDGKLQAAEGLLESAAKQAPRSARNHNNLGSYYALSGKGKQAEAAFDEAIKLKPDYALAYSNRAWLNLDLQKPEKAMVDAQQALNLKSDLRQGQLAYARACLQLGKIDLAWKMAQSADKLAPDAVSAVLQGDILVASGDLKAARQYYQKALILIPRHLPSLLKTAQIHAQLGDLDSAMKQARLAVDSYPDDAGAHLALGRYLEMNQDLRAAQLQYERALESKPEKAVELQVFGPMLRVLMATTRVDEAAGYARDWVKRYPAEADCHYNYAWVLSQLPKAKLTDAIAEYRKALEIDPKLSQAHYNLALLLVKSDQLAQAAAELRLFIETAPGDPDVNRAKELLAKLNP